MSYAREHDLDSSSTLDAGDHGGKAAGKRTLTSSMQPTSGDAADAPRTLASSPAPSGPDPFDFSFTRPLDANDQTVEAEVKKHIEAGERNVNSITDAVFYRVHPQCAGKKLAAGSKDAQTWMWIRDTFVAHAVREAGEVHATPAPAPAEAPAPTPAPAPAPAQAGGGDIYRTQNDNLYMAGGTCNMTSLTMALLSFTDGDETIVKLKTGEALRNLGKPLGRIAIDKEPHDVRRVLETPALLAKVQVEDLLTTLAGLLGLKVTSPGTILTIATKTGLVTGGKAGVTGLLKDPKVRARAAEAVRNGERLILGVMGGPGHFVFLTEMLDDGFIAHDPAGCRTQREAPFFLPTGSASERTIDRMVSSLARPGWIEAARRRLSRNPAMSAVLEKLIVAHHAQGKERTEAMKELTTGEPLAMGENNYYSLADINLYDIDIRVEMHGA